jgi:transcription elongation factor Elf1
MINKNNIKNLNKKLVLFIPETGIYSYLRGLAVLGDAIKKSGNQVFITRCTGQMFRCPMMAMKRLSVKATIEEKKQLCKICQKRFNLSQKKYNFSVINLSDFLDKKEMDYINCLSNKSQDDLENLVFKNIAVGKIAQYDFSLETKTQIYPNLSDEHKALYVLYIQNSVLSAILTEKLCFKYGPSLFITFNQYAQGQTVRLIASLNKINFFSLTHAGHKNVDTSQFILYKKLNFWFSHCAQWSRVKDLPIFPNDVSECWKDTLFHFYGSGSHIFSSKKTGDIEGIYRKLNLDNKKKTIVVYTSSNDERGGYENILKELKDDSDIIDAFSTQIDWLSWLKKYVSDRDDIQIVVRIHPREGGRQFGFESSHLLKLKKIFKNDFKNFFIIWPDDKISSYDLMEIADVCLVPWTTVGQEAARIGIPVLSYTSGMYYPDDDFIQVATTVEEYKNRLDLILKSTYSWNRLVKAVRFYHWRTFIPSLDLSETVPSDFEDTSVWPEAPTSKIEIINDVLSGKQDLIEYNMKQWQDSLPVDAVVLELESMRQGIRFFLDKIFYPPKSYSKLVERFLYIKGKIWRKYLYRHWCTLIRKNYLEKNFKNKFVNYILEFSTDSFAIDELRLKTIKNKNLRIILADGSFAILINKGKIIRRMSPMVIKIAKLYNESMDEYN